MNDKQRRRFERLRRAHSFGVSHAAEFPAASKGAEAIARLGQTVAEVEAHATTRVAGQLQQQQATTARGDERQKLRQMLSAISDTAETIGLEDPELKGRFRRLTGRVSDAALLSNARAFSLDARPLKARFLAYDMPEDFVEQLDASIEGFEQAVSRQTTGAGARLTSNAALEDALTRGEQELEKLDTVVRNKFRDDPARFAAWESARHIERATRSNKRPEAPAAR
jgi:hypothetical protein